MNSQPYRPLSHGKFIKLSQLEKMAEALQQLQGVEGTGGIQYETGATGTRIVNTAPIPMIVILGGEGGSGIGAGGGSGSANPIPADDQYNAYAGQEAIWSVVNDDFVVVAKNDGLKFSLSGIPLIEANGVHDLSAGTVVLAYPAYALGVHFYYFFAGDSLGSGSGIPITITCSDGSHHTATISGDSITVS